jgi:hypothetical protein
LISLCLNQAPLFLFKTTAFRRRGQTSHFSTAKHKTTSRNEKSFWFWVPTGTLRYLTSLRSYKPLGLYYPPRGTNVPRPPPCSIPTGAQQRNTKRPPVMRSRFGFGSVWVSTYNRINRSGVSGGDKGDGSVDCGFWIKKKAARVFPDG